MFVFWAHRLMKMYGLSSLLTMIYTMNRWLWTILTIPHGRVEDQGLLAPGIPHANVYGFRALTAIEYQQLLSQARIYAAGAPALRGLPAAVAPAAVPAAAAPAPVRGAAHGANPDPEVWIALEDEVPYVRGQVVSDAHGQLPAGHVVLGGNKALVPTAHGAVKKIRQSQLSSMDARDIRVLAMKFDPQGRRHRDFSEAVSCMIQDKMPGGELQLDGPATTLDVLKSLVSRDLTFITDHERWKRFQRMTVPSTRWR